MIQSFTCENFRNLHFHNLQLGKKVNILVGPNNSGKSNFIKALSFLANMLVSGGKEAMDSAFLYECGKNGWGKLVRRLSPRPAQVHFKWTVSLGGEEMDYFFSFSVGQQAADFYITREAMQNTAVPTYEQNNYNYFECHSKMPGQGFFSTARQKGEPNKRIPIEISNQDSILLQFKEKVLTQKDLYENPDVFKKVAPMIDETSAYFKKFCMYSSADFSLNLARRPVEIKGEQRQLIKDGSNFVNVLNYLCSKNIYNKQIFDDKLKEVLHNLVLTNITPELDSFVLRLGYDGNQFDLSDVSDGTMKALILNLIINLPVNNGISMLALDEPELNLHPAWQKVVAQWILTSPTIHQCFISTHSPDFLDVFTDEFINENVGVYVLSSGEPIKQVHYSDLREELHGWQLGDLYRTGDPALGGWPW